MLLSIHVCSCICEVPLGECIRRWQQWMPMGKVNLWVGALMRGRFFRLCSLVSWILYHVHLLIIPQNELSKIPFPSPKIVVVVVQCSVVSDSLQPHGLQHTRLPCPSPSPRACSNSCLLSWWYHPTISSSVSPSLPALSLSQHQGLFQWVSSLHQVAKVLELQLQHQSFQWMFRVDFL